MAHFSLKRFPVFVKVVNETIAEIRFPGPSSDGIDRIVIRRRFIMLFFDTLNKFDYIVFPLQCSLNRCTKIKLIHKNMYIFFYFTFALSFLINLSNCLLCFMTGCFNVCCTFASIGSNLFCNTISISQSITEFCKNIIIYTYNKSVVRGWL